MSEPNEMIDDVWVMFSIEHKCSGKAKLHYIDHDTDYAKLKGSISCREFTTSPTQVVIFKQGELVNSSFHDHIGRKI